MNDLLRMGTRTGPDLRRWPAARRRASAERANPAATESKARLQQRIYGPLEKGCAHLKLQRPDVQTSARIPARMDSPLCFLLNTDVLVVPNDDSTSDSESTVKENPFFGGLIPTLGLIARMLWLRACVPLYLLGINSLSWPYKSHASVFSFISSVCTRMRSDTWLNASRILTTLI